MEDNAPTEEPKGGLMATYNRAKVKGDRKPLFIGDITLPNGIDPRPISLWATTSRSTGQSILSGRTGRSAREQIAEHAHEPKRDEIISDAPDFHGEEREPDGPPDFVTEPERLEVQAGDGPPLDVKPNDIVLFTNPQRDAENLKRPDYFGYYNPGDGQPIMRLSVWTRTDRAGFAMLKGTVVPFERALDREMADGPVEGLEQPATEFAQQPKRKRSRERAMA